MGTRYKGTEKELRALNAYVALMRSADSVSDAAHRHLREHRLTVSQFGALEALHHCGELSLGELAGKLLRTEGSITSLVDGLEKRRLAKRIPGAEDKRLVRVSLTAQGRRLMEKVVPAHVEVITERLAAITAEQQEALRRICRTLGKGGA